MTTLAIHGAAGRMGRRLVALAHEDDAFELRAAIDRPEHPNGGQDAGELAGVGPLHVALGEELSTRVDVLIDFSTPAALRTVLGRCVELGSNLVIGTTGLGPQDHGALDEAAKTVALLAAPNMSPVVNLLFALAGRAARQLGDDCDIEIVETHHRFKRDAPSGTALGIAAAVCEATGRSIEQSVVHGRCGQDVLRSKGQIGMHALRSGDVVGRHTVSFGSLGEELQLAHIATSRDIFARGALKAAKWLKSKKTGRFHMSDMLDL